MAASKTEGETVREVARVRGHQPHDTLRHARAILAHAGALPVGATICGGRGRWPPATGEARGIARRLRCQPLLDRAYDQTATQTAAPRAVIGIGDLG